MDELFSMSFDQQSLSEIAQFAGFSVMLSDEVQAALEEGGSILVTSIRGAMHWQNPTGALEASIGIVSDSHFEIIVGSELPYAHRRDQGFDGADSLGRIYHDAGAFFMQTGMDQSQSQVLSLIDTAVEHALQRLGAV